MKRLFELAGNGDYLKALAGEVLLTALKKGLEGYAKASNQANILMAGQGKKYVPFHSSALNQAIANLTAAHKPILDIAKLLYESNGTGDSGSSGLTQNNYYMTPDEVIKQKGNNTDSLLNDNTLLAAKYEELKSHGELPNINARNEDNFDTNNESDKRNSGQKYIAQMAFRHPNMAKQKGIRPENTSHGHRDYLEAEIIDDVPKL